MPILPLILTLFIGIPLLEIYLLIEVGDVIGAFPTIIAVVFTAVLGVGLIRIQGFSTLKKAQLSMDQGKLPATELFEGMLLLFAAICLLIPGFFTDTLGFLLLIPPLRVLLANRLLGSAVIKARFHGAGFRSTGNTFYEGEYEDLTTRQHEHKQESIRQNYVIEGTVESDNEKKDSN